VFRQTYPGTPPVEHLDLYRLDDPAREWADLALDEAFGPDRIVLVEWPERAPGLLPPQRIEVSIEGAGESPRTVRVTRRS